MVERADPNYDVSFIKIDSADDSNPIEVYYSRLNTFSICWVMNEIMNQTNGKVKDILLTTTIPIRGGEKEISQIKVPNWARHKLHRKLLSFCQELGWDGKCPRPQSDSVYRS